MKKTLLLLAFSLSTLCSTAQILDPSFENWATDTFGNRYLTDWEHFVGSTTMVNQNYFGTYRDTIPTDGNYALTLSRWYYYTWDRVQQTKPITFSPAALTGYYRYTNNEVTGIYSLDSALVQVFLISQTDTVGTGRIELGAKASFSHFYCPIVYSSTQTPDQVSIHLAPTKWTNGGAQSPEPWGCFFTIDNLSLTAVAGTTDPKPSSNLLLYPNPAKSNVNIRLDVASKSESSIQLLDFQGRLLRQKTLPSGDKYDLNVNDLPSGLYSVKVISDKNVWVEKLVIE